MSSLCEGHSIFVASQTLLFHIFKRLLLSSGAVRLFSARLFFAPAVAISLNPYIYCAPSLSNMPAFSFPKSFFGIPRPGSREKYNPVRGGDENDNDTNSLLSSESQYLHPPRGRWNTTIAFLLAIICSSLFIVLATIHLGLTVPVSDSTPNVITSPCGSTPQDARARGCHFDVISFCWLPDACYDAELSDAFDNITTWEWFLDPNRTQPISHQQAMTGELTGLYVNWEYHLRHCTAMWEKLHRAILGTGKSAIDGYIGRLEHTKHCSQMLLKDRDVALETINTIILVKYPACGIA